MDSEVPKFTPPPQMPQNKYVLQLIGYLVFNVVAWGEKKKLHSDTHQKALTL